VCDVEGTRECYFCKQEIAEGEPFKEWVKKSKEKVPVHLECMDRFDAFWRKSSEVFGKGKSFQHFRKDFCELVDDGKTLDDIEKTFDWYYLVEHNDPTLASGGLAILGYVYGRAVLYWKDQERLKLAAEQRENREREISEWLSGVDTQEVEIRRPRIGKPKRVPWVDMD
jgi:hypothetical protein